MTKLTYQILGPPPRINTNVVGQHLFEECFYVVLVQALLSRLLGGDPVCGGLLHGCKVRLM